MTVETFVRIESRILMSIAFFWLVTIIYEVLLTLRESLLALSQVSTPTSSLFTVAWTLLMTLLDAKTVVSSAKWTKRNWFDDLYMSLICIDPSQKKKYWAQHRSLWNTQCNAWGRGTAVFDWDVVLPITQIRLKPVLMTPLMQLCRSLLINMLWLTVSNFNNIKNFYNINVQNARLLNVDPDHNRDFQLPNCINVDQNDLLINQLSTTTFSCLSLNISSLKKHFQTLQTEITDNFSPSVIGLCETKIDSNIEQL